MSVDAAAVLVVVDVAENRDLLVRRLKRLGIGDVEQATNGVEALAAIDRRDFDVVLLDIMMPELDGFGVLERLKADGKVNDLPIIVISALNEIDPIVRCIELGAEDFIFKPFNPTLLRARVLATLEKKLLRDHFRLADDTVVSDKGAGAALVMARTHSLIRGPSARPDAAQLVDEPAQALEIVNAALAAGNDSCMFVTFLLGVLHLAGNRLTYVRVGHVPPFLRRAGGSIERLAHNGGLPLGMMEGTAYFSTVADFNSGDLLLVVTDGFTESTAPTDELYGDARVERCLAALDPTAPNLLDALVKDVRNFEAGRPASDDMAAVLVSTT